VKTERLEQMEFPFVASLVRRFEQMEFPFVVSIESHGVETRQDGVSAEKSVWSTNKDRRSFGRPTVRFPAVRRRTETGA